MYESTTARRFTSAIAPAITALLACVLPALADIPVQTRREPTTWHLTYNQEPEIELLSSPARAQVTLRGSSQLGGVTPFSVPGNLRGRYTVQVSKPGFERGSARFDFVSRGAGARPIPSPRAAWAAAIAPPGFLEWRDAGQRRGWIALSSASFDLAAAGWAHKQASDYEAEAQTWRQLNVGGSIPTDDVFELEVNARHAERRADVWRTARRNWLVMAGGLWTVSALSRTLLAPALETSFDGEGRLELSVSPISKAGVFARSAVLPGWGQGYTGRSKASGWFMLGGLGFLSTTVATHHATLRAEADVYAADQRVEYYRHTDPQKTAAALSELEDAQASADRWNSVRYVSLGLTTGLWAYNLFDAIRHAESAPRLSSAAATGPTVAARLPIDGRLGIELRF